MKLILIGLLAALPLTVATPMHIPAELDNARAGEWRMFEVDLEPGLGAPCCVDWERGQKSGQACGLDADSWNFSSDRAAVPGTRLKVFLRRGEQGVDRVRAYGSSCQLTAEAQAVPLIDLADGADTRLLSELAMRGSKKAADGAVAALALTAGDDAGRALAALTRPEAPGATRHNATFWLTQTRGAYGFDTVRALLGYPDESRKLRSHAVFALSQSAEPGRDQALIELSRTDADAEIRGEALFWLAQVSPAAAEPALLAAVHADSRKLRDKAIFALSQLPAERAVKQLSALAADQTLPRETRKQALFWLSQADPDAAIPEVDRLLGVE